MVSIKSHQKWLGTEVNRNIKMTPASPIAFQRQCMHSRYKEMVDERKRGFIAVENDLL